MKSPRLLPLLAITSFSSILLTARPAQQSGQGLQMPASMYSSHEGSAVANAGLSEKEISNLLSLVLTTGLDDDDMRSAAALRKELLSRHVDMGEGANKGLVLQGNARLCGATGNCALWLFRRVGLNWKLVGPKNNAPLAGAFGFVATKHHNLYDLVVANHIAANAEAIGVWQFNGTIYEQKQSYCSHNDSEIVPGDCQ